MVLNLISEAARLDGSVGPELIRQGVPVLALDWLSDTRALLALRALVVRGANNFADEPPSDPTAAAKAVDTEIRERVS